jgi:diaminopimelate decarboxylase
MEQIIKNSILKKDKILKLARIVQTPAYIYDLSSIKARVKELINIKYDTKYYAATMSNFNPKLLKLYKKNNLGVFVNSEMHFKLVKKCGFSGRQIIWTSSGMTKDQIIKAYKEKVILNLDSNGQLELYGSLFPNSKVGIRVNIIDMPNNETYAGAFVGPNSRIGILPSEFKETNKIAKKYNLTINGLHVYLGTQKTNLDHFTTGAILLARYLKFFDSLEYIDLGGGFGLPEDEQSFNFKKYNSEISSLMSPEEFWLEIVVFLLLQLLM